MHQVRKFLESSLESIELRFREIVHELEDRSIDLEAQQEIYLEFMNRGKASYENFKAHIEKLGNWQQRIEKLTDGIRRYGTELNGVQEHFLRVEKQTQQVRELDRHLKEQWRWASGLRTRLEESLSAHYESLQEQLQRFNEQEQQRLTERLQGLEQDLEQLGRQEGEQRQRLTALEEQRGGWDQTALRLQEDKEELVNQQTLLYQEMGAKQEKLRKFVSQVGEHQGRLQEQLSQLDREYESIQTKTSEELQRHRGELLEQIRNQMTELRQRQEDQVQSEGTRLLENVMKWIEVRTKEYQKWALEYFERFALLENELKQERSQLLVQFRSDLEKEISENLQARAEKSGKLAENWQVLEQNYLRLSADLQQIEEKSRGALSAQFAIYEKEFAENLVQKQQETEVYLGSWAQRMQSSLEELDAKLQAGGKEKWESATSQLEHEYSIVRQQMENRINAAIHSLQDCEGTLNRFYLDQQREQEEWKRTFAGLLRNSNEGLERHLVELKGQGELRLEQLFQSFEQDFGEKQIELENRSVEKQTELNSRWKENFAKLELLNEKLREFEREVEKKQSETGKKYDEILTRINSESERITNYFHTIEQQQQHVLVNANLIERAEALWKETRDNIARLKEQSNNLETFSERAGYLQKEFAYMSQLAKDLGNRVQILQGREERAEKLYEMLSDLDQTLEGVEKKWQVLQSREEKLLEIEAELEQVGKMYKQRGQEFLVLQERAVSIEAQQGRILEGLSSLEGLQSEIAELKETVTPLENKAEEMKTLHAKIEAHRERTEEVVVQINSLQRLLGEAQSKASDLRKLREWLVRTEERMSEMQENLDANIRLAEQLSLQGGENSDLSGAHDMSRIDIETRTMVQRLHEKGWDNRTIAKHLNISVGAVELILEMSSLL